MKTKYNKKRFMNIILIVVLLVAMSIGFSYISKTLETEGTIQLKDNNWSIKWTNATVLGGSITGDQVITPAHILEGETEVEYSIILKNPGEYYEFEVNSKNYGTIDAKIDSIKTEIYELNDEEKVKLDEIPEFLECTITDTNGDEIEANHLLLQNESMDLKFKTMFKEDIEEENLPSLEKTYIIEQKISYVQN